MLRDRSVVLDCAASSVKMPKLRRAAAKAVVETLEPRQLLSAIPYNPTWTVLPVPESAGETDIFPWGFSTYNFNGLTWTDVEKNTLPGDDLLCWAGTASNMLEFTGWGFVDTLPPMTNSDDMFEHFVDKWIDEGGWIDTGIDWWFDGDAAGLFVNKPGGGGFYPQLDPLSYTNVFNLAPDRPDAFVPGFGEDGAMGEAFNAVLGGEGMGLSLHGGGLAHAVTLWGLRVNPEVTFQPAPTDDTDAELWKAWGNYLNAKYEGVWISDSDNGPQMLERRDSPNTLNYYPVEWNNTWTISSYWQGASITSLTTLARRDGFNVPMGFSLSNGTVEENRPKGTIIGDLIPQDLDTINNVYVFDFVEGLGGGDNDLFSIANGQLRTNAIFNYEAKSSYSIRVRMTDQTGLFTETELTIAVKDVNEQPLAINLAASPFTRTSPAGTPAGVFSTVDPDVAPAFTGPFTYELVNGAGSTDNALFTIGGAQNNQLLLTDISGTTQQTFSIRVRTTDRGGLSFEQVFTIQPSPTDIQLSAASVDENLPAGSLVASLSAVDSDGAMVWALAGSGASAADNWMFRIVGNELRTSVPLNYELQKTLKITVRGVNQYGWAIQKAFTLSVNDKNDASSDLILTGNAVRPTMAAGAVVGQLATQDEDAGQLFTYALVLGTGSGDNGMFQIVGNELRLKEPLKLPLRDNYNIRVRSTDTGHPSGDPAKWIEKTFSILLAGNSAPFSVSFTSPAVREDLPIGDLVGTFAGVDPDPADLLIYTLVSGLGSDDNSLFEVRGDELHTRAALDFEAGGIYLIRFRATDSYGAWIENTAQITVVDVPEAPTDLVLSNSEFSENLPAGFVIGSFTTADQDNGGAGTFTFLLVNGSGDTDNARFEISGNDLRAVGSFDFEKELAARRLADPAATDVTFSIRVRVVDETMLGYDRVFTITLNDELDDYPYFVLSSSTVLENSPAPTAVGVFTPMDPNRVLQYELVPMADDNAQFELDPVTGQLTVRDSLNFEARAQYTIRVKATDISPMPAHPFTEYTTTFNVAVVDVNDRPSAINILQRNTITRNSPLGTWVMRLATIDEDTRDTFTYSLVSGYGSNDNAFFRLVGNELQVKQTLASQPDRTFTVRIRSTDAAGMYVERFVNVYPSVAPAGIVLSTPTIPENMPTGSVVGTLSAIDPDVNESFTYAIVGGDTTAFVVEGMTLKSAMVFDYEVRSSYSLDIQVTDKGGWTFVATIPISVTNVDEAPTDITLSNLTVVENQAGAVVGDLSATLPPTAVVPASLVLFDSTTYPDNDVFQIVNGQLVTKLALNYEVKNSYTIQIRATAGGESFDKQFTIAVTDVNEAPTNITLSPALVRENRPVGTVVGMLQGIDPDAGDTATVSLVQSPSYPDNQYFIINPDGSLATLATFNYEVKRSYSIRVMATDSQGLTFAKTLTVSVTDANDTPQIIRLTNTDILLDSQPGYVVSEVQVSDEDPGDSFTTSLVAGEGDDDNYLFEVDYLKLKIKQPLPTDQTSFSILIGVTDSRGASTSRQFTLSVPASAPTDISLSGDTILDGSPVGSAVGTLTTTDASLGDVWTYSFVGGLGSDDNNLFAIVGDQLRTASAVDIADGATYSVRIRTMDSLGQSFSKAFTIVVTPMAAPVRLIVEPPAVLTEEPLVKEEPAPASPLTPLLVAPAPAVINGTEGDDVIVIAKVGDQYVYTINGTPSYANVSEVSSITINALGGNDIVTILPDVIGVTVNAGAGDDSVAGGTGDDLIYGGDGNDTLLGAQGLDTIYGNFGNDVILGGSQRDLIYGGLGDDEINGNEGPDMIYAGNGVDLVRGGLGADYIEGRGKTDNIYGGEGNDTILGGAGADAIFGGSGDDVLYANRSELFGDYIDGGDGTDSYEADADDTLSNVEVDLLI